jgi:RAP domain
MDLIQHEQKQQQQQSVFDNNNMWLSIPDNFPDDWICQSDTTSDKNGQKKLSIMTSKLHLEVSDSLNQIGFQHVNEYTISMKDLVDEYNITLPSQYNMDIITIDIANIEKKIAIEVDGPSHYNICINTKQVLVDNNCIISNRLQYEPNGSTLFKRRLLQQMGWNVIIVPYWDWNAMHGDTSKQVEYCRNLHL